MSDHYKPKPLEQVLFSCDGRHFLVSIDDEKGELSVMAVGTRMGKLLVSPRDFNSITVSSEKPGLAHRNPLA